MNMLKQLNLAIDYIEINLCNEINIDEAAKIACVTSDSFLRFFSYMTGMTLNEYVRRRRLSLAINDLQQSNEKVISIALKYGYESTNAFSKSIFQPLVLLHGIEKRGHHSEFLQIFYRNF